MSAIRRVSRHLTSEGVVLKEYVQLLHNFAKNLDSNSSLEQESYSRKALLLRVYGHISDPSLSKSSSSGNQGKRLSMSGTLDFDSHESKTSRYDLEVFLDQIQILGLNPLTLLNRDSPTLYLSMTIQHSHVTTEATSIISPLASQSAIPVLTIPLHYSHSTSTWHIKLSQHDDHHHSSAPPPSHLFSLSSHAYSHCVLFCELWYKSFLTRTRKNLGTIHFPLGALDTNGIHMTKPIDVSQSSEEFKERVSASHDQTLQLKMLMKLKPSHRGGVVS